jgi:hypothetical protein
MVPKVCGLNANAPLTTNHLTMLDYKRPDRVLEHPARTCHRNALGVSDISERGAGANSGPARCPLYSILVSKLPLSEDWQVALGETIVTELSSKQAREKCHQTLVAGLRLVRPEERVTAIAAAMQEVEAREKLLYAAVVRQGSGAGPAVACPANY